MRIPFQSGSPFSKKYKWKSNKRKHPWIDRPLYFSPLSSFPPTPPLSSLPLNPSPSLPSPLKYTCQTNKGAQKWWGRCYFFLKIVLLSITRRTEVLIYEWLFPLIFASGTPFKLQNLQTENRERYNWNWATNINIFGKYSDRSHLRHVQY